MNRVLGVDCGNVILCQGNGTPVAGAFDALRAIVQSGTFESVYIVSKCGQRMQENTLKWLLELNFWNHTGIPDTNIRFCREFWQKEPICRELGITHFVDDRPNVLNCLTSVEHLYAFRPKPHRMGDYKQEKPLIVVYSWEEVLQHLL